MSGSTSQHPPAIRPYPVDDDLRPTPDISRSPATEEDEARSKKRRGLPGNPSSRTGQACDRCKRRKIRCDGMFGGCMPCRQNHTECKTTDRNTNTARARGHTEQLEQHCTFLTHHVQELHAQIRDLGHEPVNTVGYQGSLSHEQWRDHRAQLRPSSSHSDGDGSRGQASPSLSRHCVTSHLPNVLSHPRGSDGQVTIAGIHTLAVPPNDLSTGIEQPLCLFGHNLNIEDFSASEPGDPRSYDTYVDIIKQSTGGAKQKYWRDLPYLVECKGWVDAYLQTGNSYLPILHGPHINELVAKMYEPNWKGTAAEAVIVRICLASIMYQASCRNLGDPHRDEISKASDAHYHYAVSLLPELYVKVTLQNIQALTMICMHLRTLPNCQTAHRVLAYTFRHCLEISLHRSAKALPESERPKDQLTIELRKRIFWTLLLLYVPVCGKLGQPMPLQPEDIDIELPELLDDDLQPAKGRWGEETCPFFHAIIFMKLGRIHLEMWRTKYAPGPMKDHIGKIEGVESALRHWKEHDWPDLLKGPPEDIADPHYRVMAGWLHWWSDELEYYLYHPTRAMGIPSQPLPPHVLNKAIDTATQLIQITIVLWRAQALDTTWMSGVSFMGAIYSLLYCLDRRQQRASITELDKLKGDLTVCLEVVGAIGNMIKPGSQLQDHVRTIVDKIFERIRLKGCGTLAPEAFRPPIRQDSDGRKPSSTSQSSVSGLDTKMSSEYGSSRADLSHSLSPMSQTQQPQPPRRTSQNSSSSGAYQSPVNGDVQQYHYEAYNQDAAQFRPIVPGESQYLLNLGAGQQYNQGQNQIHSPTNQIHSPTAPWTHYQSEFVPDMGSANGLMSLSGGGDAQHGHEQPMVYPMHLPNLMPAQGMQAMYPQEMHWPYNTWGPQDENVGEG